MRRSSKYSFTADFDWRFHAFRVQHGGHYAKRQRLLLMKTFSIPIPCPPPLRPALLLLAFLVGLRGHLDPDGESRICNSKRTSKPGRPNGTTGGIVTRGRFPIEKFSSSTAIQNWNLLEWCGMEDSSRGVVVGMHRRFGAVA